VTTAAATAPVRAGFFSRLTAFVVDAAILAISIHGTVWLLTATARALGRLAPPINLAVLLYRLAPIWIAFYIVASWIAFGQTPGKWLLGIKVVALGGGRLKVRHALIRFVGYLVSALPFYAGFIWVLGPQRRAWHDILAHTEVVYVERDEPRTSRGGQLRQQVQAALRPHVPAGPGARP
jgi:uncharacterized RDD family membrane protein YckC